MPHTHHSHSGSFCNHAVDSLESIVNHAFDRGMTTVSLTEHVPRPDSQLYPGELEMGWDSVHQSRIFDSFLNEASRIRAKVESRASAANATALEKQQQILLGFESEWIDENPATAKSRIQGVLDSHSSRLDFWIGSVHHVRGEPIDFDAAGYERALQACGGDENYLFASYFDAQYNLLETMHPPIVGHFDLIRLLSRAPDMDWRERAEGRLWKLIKRNLGIVRGYGGVLEINTAAWRKGLSQPYPRSEIVELWTNSLSGMVVLSDDSHAKSQVGICYDRVLQFLRQSGVAHVGVLRGRRALPRTISLNDLEQHPFWSLANPPRNVD